MLRNFIYLDEEQLNQYISQVEDGLRRSASRSVSADKNRSAEVNAKVAKFGLGGHDGEAASWEYSDDGPARFERLLALVEGDEDQFGWRDVQENSDALTGLRAGHVLAFAGEIYESDVSKISAPTGILSMIPLARAINRMQGTEGSGLDQFDEGTLGAIETFGEAMRGKSVVQGDILETDWRFCALLPAALPSEGDAYIVGKVSKVWGENQWRPLPGLPILSQLPREQRREMERKGPRDDKSKMMWLEGPAVELDLLAIYR